MYELMGILRHAVPKVSIPQYLQCLPQSQVCSGPFMCLSHKVFMKVVNVWNAEAVVYKEELVGIVVMHCNTWGCRRISKPFPE